MRISDWSSDVCSSDLTPRDPPCPARDGWNPRLAAMQQLSHSAVEPELDTRRPRRRTQRSGGGGDERGHGRRKRRRPHCGGQIGRASCRERECQYGLVSVAAVSLKTKNIKVKSQ